MNSAGGQIRWNNELLHREAIRSVIADELGVKLKNFNSSDPTNPHNGTLKHEDFQQMKKDITLVKPTDINSADYSTIKVGKWIREADWLFVHAPGENKTILFGDQNSQLKGGGDGVVLGGKGKNSSASEKKKHGLTKAGRMLNMARNDPKKEGVYEGDKDYVGGGFLEDLTTWEGVRSLGRGGIGMGIGKAKYSESEKVWEEVSSVFIIAEEDFCN
jgi:hypothetical protein